MDVILKCIATTKEEEKEHDHDNMFNLLSLVKMFHVMACNVQSGTVGRSGQTLFILLT